MSNFIYQENQYKGALLPCTRADFNRIVDSSDVSWRIGTRQQVENAIAEGLPLDSFLSDVKFQQFCAKHSDEAGFQELSPEDRLRRWTNSLKMGLPCFIFSAKAFRENQRKLEYVVLSNFFILDLDHLPCDGITIYQRTQAEGFHWKLALAYYTSSGRQGVRMVVVARPELGNLADNQVCLARDLGVLDMMGTTGKPVTDDSCVDATRISYAPRREDILYMDEELLFGTEDDGEAVTKMEQLYGETYRQGRGSSNPIHPENRFFSGNAPTAAEVTPLPAASVTVGQDTQAATEFPLVFGHQPLDYVNVLLPNGAPRGSRHNMGLYLATDLILLRDGNLEAVRHDLMQLGFIRDIVNERGPKELDGILATAQKRMEKREQEYISPRPSANMRSAIETVTGVSYNTLVAEQNSRLTGTQSGSSEDDLQKFLVRLGKEIKSLMPRYPLLELLCHGLPMKNFVAALFIGGAFAMTLMTRCWYRFWAAPARRCRMNCILELIGRMGTRKHLLVDLYRIMMQPIKEADQPQIDALNKWNMEHDQKNGSSKNSTPRPTGIYRCLPCDSSAAAIRDTMVQNTEEIDGEKVQLHVSIMDSELDNTLTQMKKDYMNIASLHLKAFHNEPQGAFLKTTTAYVGEIDITANFMYSGTEYALSKQVTPDNYGSGLPTRLTVVPMGDSNFEMMENRKYTPEDEARDHLLSLWSHKLDRTRGEVPVEKISDALHKWTARRMDEAKENNSKAEEDLLKRVCWHTINYSIPFIVTHHWEQMKQDEHGFWVCDDGFSTDKYDLQLALLIAKAQLAFQHYFFKGIAEEYYRRLENNQLTGKHYQGHTQIAYNRLPAVFTREDVDHCYGYEGNRNSINSCIKRLQDDGKAQRIRSGNDKGKYRKTA